MHYTVTYALPRPSPVAFPFDRLREAERLNASGSASSSRQANYLNTSLTLAARFVETRDSPPAYERTPCARCLGSSHGEEKGSGLNGVVPCFTGSIEDFRKSHRTHAEEIFEQFA